MPLLHPALLAEPALLTDLASLTEPALPTGPAPVPPVPQQCLSDEPGQVDLRTLRTLTAALAAHPQVWRPVIRHRADRRWYTRLLLSATVEVWLIGWCPGQQTEIHDHGGALGALTVVEGQVEEDRFDRAWSLTGVRAHRPGASVGFGIRHVHRVANRSTHLATTIHAYSPPELPLRYSPTDSGAAGTTPVATAPDQVAPTYTPAGVTLPATRPGGALVTR
ncbi:Cysteine dioxygenase [Frankia sp. AiPs1]|uniref:cysteine dioxygenase n=1 Tax=Frankia sp. AiPa1 TaxID=573492 RepID=UPI00202B3CB7|nr:cysteine dioxygenase family protein [Frankia sp. AiPa1]MCL9761572.1 cysteine dioxygenase family protein [Frankia sp. AiPa1]